MDLAILAFNLGHDGAVVHLKNGFLQFSIEREKNSHPRFSHVSSDLILEGIRLAGEVPDVFAIGGWSVRQPTGEELCAGYFGIDEQLATTSVVQLFGNKITLFHSTHERSHIFCSYGLSSLEEGRPCYVLVWEGELGAFYEIDESLKITLLGVPLKDPGYKYSFAFDLANPKYAIGKWRFDSAGKLMALASYSTHGPTTIGEQQAIDQILGEVRPPLTEKRCFQGSPYLDCGVTHPAFTEFAGKFSDAIFEVFHSFARQHLKKKYPLLIGGGCGLNCEWNSRWRDSGLFPTVFVPPVPNDSGSAIGTAIEAQYRLTGNPKVEWDVYRGLGFVWDQEPDDYHTRNVDSKALAEMLALGKIVAWVQGRFEIGPRALGNRSLLAAPFDGEMTARLNLIKKRDGYRPVAPVCLEEDAFELFGMAGPSPHMLYLGKTRSPKLRAVTHVDGTARVQTVSKFQNPQLYDLLLAFKQLTGFGVLCNTSLNFPGRGFINRSSELFRFILERKIDAAVVDDKLYVPKQ
jgi:predicted NodU family carbamoyl transferase